MRVLVIHASRYGSTHEIAEWIGEKLTDNRLEATVKAVNISATG